MDYDHIMLLPKEIHVEIILRLTIKDIINYRQCNKIIKNICDDIYLWKRKIEYDFMINPSVLDWDKYSFYEIYLKLKNNTLAYRGCENVLSINVCFFNSIENNNEELMKYFIDKGANPLLVKYDKISISAIKYLLENSIITLDFVLSATNNRSDILDYANNLIKTGKAKTLSYIIMNKEIKINPNNNILRLKRDKISGDIKKIVKILSNFHPNKNDIKTGWDYVKMHYI